MVSGKRGMHILLVLLSLWLGALMVFAPPSAALAPAWQPDTPYSVGDLVSYDGIEYQCIQSHTSQAGWEPPNVPALWSPQTAAQTATTTPVTTITPTATRTSSTATATASAEPGGCAAPGWLATAVYTGGDIVSHKGHTWKARWWTQGEEPGTTGEWGVWQDLGACAGATPTPGATATPSPAPSATPQTTSTPTQPPVDGLPRRLMVGYWHNFDNGSAVIRLRDVSARFDVINVAFAETGPAGDGTMTFTPFNATADEFRSDIRYLQSLGKQVLLSIGGANSVVELHDRAGRDNFINSMISIVESYGFNGIDIDLEGSSLALDSGDTDFANPTTPKIVNLIAAVKAIDDHFGAGFLLTMAPETAYVQGGITAYGGPWGAYLPVIHALRDRLNYIHVQHYNSGSMEALDGRSYAQGTADFHVAMAEMLLHGFSIAHNDNNFFPPLREDQVAIGLPASSSAAGGGYTQPAEVHRALDYLITGSSFGGSYILRRPAGYPDFRGLMTWSINWDAVNNYEFSTSHRAYLDSLP